MQEIFKFLPILFKFVMQMSYFFHRCGSPKKQIDVFVHVNYKSKMAPKKCGGFQRLFLRWCWIEMILILIKGVVRKAIFSILLYSTFSRSFVRNVTIIYILFSTNIFTYLYVDDSMTLGNSETSVRFGIISPMRLAVLKLRTNVQCYKRKEPSCSHLSIRTDILASISRDIAAKRGISTRTKSVAFGP